MNEIKEKITALMKKQKFGKDSLLILILSGLLLLVIAWPTGRKEEKKGTDGIKSEQSDAAGGMLNVPAQSDTEADYGEELERRLSSLLREMEGVGRVKVMVTFASTCEEIPLKDVTRTDKDTTETDGAGGTRIVNESAFEEATICVTDEEGNRIPYVVRTTQPEVIGVAVIAEGGDRPEIQKKITAVIQSLFRIDANRIIVTKMKA